MMESRVLSQGDHRWKKIACRASFQLGGRKKINRYVKQFSRWKEVSGIIRIGYLFLKGHY